MMANLFKIAGSLFFGIGENNRKSFIQQSDTIIEEKVSYKFSYEININIIKMIMEFVNPFFGLVSRSKKSSNTKLIVKEMTVEDKLYVFASTYVYIVFFYRFVIIKNMGDNIKTYNNQTILSDNNVIPPDFYIKISANKIIKKKRRRN